MSDDEQYIYIVPELCYLESIPENVQATKEVLGPCRKTPAERVKLIMDMATKIAKSKDFKQWGVQIQDKPISLTTRILPAPKMIDGNKMLLDCTSQNLRRGKVLNGNTLERWILVYQKRDFHLACDFVESFANSGRQLNLQVYEPEYIELGDQTKINDLERDLKAIMSYHEEKIPVVALIYSANLYPKYKQVFYNMGLVSQIIRTKSICKMNLSVLSNILKQLMVKEGSELYTLQYPKQVKPDTMLIGLDVCHKGAKSVVGMCASFNNSFSKYYSSFKVQNKNQEIVLDLEDFARDAIRAYLSHNPKGQPKHVIYYRDGVGDSMRDQVTKYEINSIMRGFRAGLNKVHEDPLITVIIVNKRINQRVFLQDDYGQVQNPPTGTIVDQAIVEGCDTGEKEGTYDFYLVPQETTQGCVLPTHFFVAQDNSGLTRETVQELTYALCHGYLNWAGPIKVPAPCMYAHKIAYLADRTLIKQKDLGKLKEFDPEICEKLHFI